MPMPGADDNVWGNILNDFLAVSHNSDGTLQGSALAQAGGVTTVNGKTSTNGTINLDAGDVGALASKASASGDLSGAYPNPTVTGTHLSAALPVNQGGTGSTTQNFITLGGDLGNSVTAPTVESIKGVSISGAPTSGQAIVATGSSAASWQTVTGTTDWINVVTLYGADPSGTNDSTTAIQNALNALPASGGVVYLPAGTYKVSSTLTFTGLYGYVRGAGRWATTLKFTGTGDCLRIYNTDITGLLTGGGVLDLAIDGNSAGAGSTGLHYGDMRAGELNVAVKNFSGTGSIGILLDNQYGWTEDCHGYLWLSNNTQNVVFNVGGANTSTNSFGYSDFTVEILSKTGPAGTGQDGIVLQNGALLYNSKFSVRANFQSSATTAQTNAVVRITGQIPAGHPNAGSYSAIHSCRLDVQAECNTTGSNTPQTIVWGSLLGANSILGCMGVLDFAQGGGSFVASNWTATGSGGTFGFTGIIRGDFNLNNAMVGAGAAYPALAVSGATVYGKSLLNIINGNLSVDSGDFFENTLIGNITINLNPGGGATMGGAQRKTIIIKQAASGGPYTVAWPTSGSPTTLSPNVVWSGGTAPTMSTAPGVTDLYNLVTYDGATWFGEAQQASTSVSQNVFAPNGLSGATASSRYVGATTSGPPLAGGFLIGDYVIDQTGSIWVCVTAGSPGTWVQLISTAFDANSQNLTSGETCIPRVPGPGTGAAATTQLVQLSFWTAIKTETVTTIGISTASTAAGATPTYCALGMYTLNNDNSLTLVGQCANDTTLFASTFTYYTRALTASFQKVQGKRYAHAVLVVSAATMPNFLGYNGTVGMTAVSPVLAGKITGQSTLPASVSSGGWSTSSNMYLGSITP